MLKLTMESLAVTSVNRLSISQANRYDEAVGTDIVGTACVWRE